MSKAKGLFLQMAFSFLKGYFFILIVMSKASGPFCKWLFLFFMGFSRPPPDAHLGIGYAPQSLTPQQPTCPFLAPGVACKKDFIVPGRKYLGGTRGPPLLRGGRELSSVHYQGVRCTQQSPPCSASFQWQAGYNKHIQMWIVCEYPPAGSDGCVFPDKSFALWSVGVCSSIVLIFILIQCFSLWQTHWLPDPLTQMYSLTRGSSNSGLLFL